MMKAKILFLATHPKEVASTRHRILAYEPVLRKQGYEVRFHPFFPSPALRAIYAPGRRWEKASWLLRGSRERWQVLRSESYDLIFIHRELFPLGLPVGMGLFQRELRRLGSPVIYDFDDAVFLPHRQNRGWIGKLENPASVRSLISMSRRVIAGNPFLAQYARGINGSTDCIPTPVDTERYFPAARKDPAAAPSIAWIGSPSTAKYLLSLAPVFRELARTRPFRLKIIGAGKPVAFGGDLQVEWKAWDLLTEAEEFRSCDIGVYPLWDDEWSRGKCGFKALQFMASGVPVIASAVGVNSQILQHRLNGLLARTPEEWFRLLSELIQDASLRRALGAAGRSTVEERYSLARLSPAFLAVLESVLERSHVRHHRPSRIPTLS